MKAKKMPNRHQSNRHGRAAFTLIEIVVVLVIVAIAAGAIAPRFQGGMDRRQLDSASTIIANALTYCHSAAAAEGRRYQWAWDETAGLARYLYEHDPLQSPGEFVPALVGQRQNQKLPESIQLEGIYFPVVQASEDEAEIEMPPVITFYPDGHATSAYVVLRIKPPEGTDVEQDESNSASVLVSGITGRVRIVPGNITLSSEEEDAE